MRYLLGSFGLVFGVCQGGYALQSCPVPSYKAIYSVYSDGKYLGDHKDQLIYLPKNAYEMEGNSDFHVLFFSDHLQSKSMGKYDRSGFFPLSYHFSESVKGVKLKRTMNKGVQDNLTIGLALSAKLLANPKVGKFSLKLDDGHTVHTIHYTVSSTKHTATLKGYRKLSLVKVTADTPGGETDYYLANALHYMPVSVVKWQDKKPIKSVMIHYQKVQSTLCV